MIPWTLWRADPLPLFGACAALALYLAGARAFARRRGRPWRLASTVAFVAGMLLAVLAIESPLDALADASFATHMLQHLILTDVCAPLLLLGAPVLMAFGALPRGPARMLARLLRSTPARLLVAPPFAWLQFVVVLWGVHYSPLYDLALRDETVHAVEHALFLGSALLFWLPVIPLGHAVEIERGLAYPMRMLYVFLAMPSEGLLGFTLYTARRPSYAAYAERGNPFGVSALADQRYAGETMWLGAMLLMFLAILLCIRGWARAESAEGRRLDALLDAERATSAR